MRVVLVVYCSTRKGFLLHRHISDQSCHPNSMPRIIIKQEATCACRATPKGSAIGVFRMRDEILSDERVSLRFRLLWDIC